MFSRFCVFLGIAFLLLGGTMDVHAQEIEIASLQAIADTGPDIFYSVGDTLVMEFIAVRGAGFAAGVNLAITHSGLTDVVISNGGTTNVTGFVIVSGTITAASGVYIQAEWPAQGLQARVYFNIADEEPIEEEAIDFFDIPYLLVDTGGDRIYTAGDTVTATFIAKRGAVPAAGVNLAITHNGLTNVTITPSNSTTDIFGWVTVNGTITAASGFYIEAEWPAADLKARAQSGINTTTSPAKIVVNPPNPKSPLAVGDTFTQTISVENHPLENHPLDSWFPTVPLSAWQMDVVYDPLILEVLDVTEGEFLESDGQDAQFFIDRSPGRITIKQVRTDGNGMPITPGGSGELVALTFRLLLSSETLVGLQNVRLSDASGERMSYSVTLTPVVATHASTAAEDVNQDGIVDILDLVVVANSIGGTQHLRADVNDDDSIDVLDLVAIVGSPLWGQFVVLEQVREPNAAAPAASPLNLMPETIREWITLAQLKNDGSLLYQRGIANFEALLTARLPSQTRLLSNYPNPFNPETWIPYQLSEPANVTLSIYSINGNLVRTLILGYQPAGIYHNKSRAAYWDGRNELGERVASGLYFYTLAADEFTATRKMLIRK